MSRSRTPDPGPDLAVEVRGLTRRFGRLTALDGVDLTVSRGSFFGLIGANGAGKSTAVRLLCGLLRPHAGRMRVAGVDPVTDGRRLRQRIGAVLDFPTLFDELTARENLLRFARLRGIPEPDARARITELAEGLQLGAALDRPVGSASQGERKKASLAAALLHAPEVLFLDEPFEGVDPSAVRTIRSILRSLQRRGVTIMMTSHVMPVVESLVSEVAILHRGRVVRSGPLGEVLADHGDLESAVLATEGERDPPELAWYRPA